MTVRFSRFLTKMFLACSALLFTFPSASAETMCTTHAKMVESLANIYNEAPKALGLASNGGMVVLYSDPTGKTWTIIITRPNGISCLVLDGEAWEELPLKIAGSVS